LLAWEKCDDPAEAEGKGVAIKSTTQFFTWLKEADDEDEDDSEKDEGIE
jgi:translation initiation factor 4G